MKTITVELTLEDVDVILITLGELVRHSASAKTVMTQLTELVDKLQDAKAQYTAPLPNYGLGMALEDFGDN